MVQKKKYTQPELKSREVQMGVFGSYGRNMRDGRVTAPIPAVSKLNLRME